MHAGWQAGRLAGRRRSILGTRMHCTHSAATKPGRCGGVEDPGTCHRPHATAIRPAPARAPRLPHPPLHLALAHIAGHEVLAIAQEHAVGHELNISRDVVADTLGRGGGRGKQAGHAGEACSGVRPAHITRVRHAVVCDPPTSRSGAAGTVQTRAAPLGSTPAERKPGMYQACVQT